MRYFFYVVFIVFMSLNTKYIFSKEDFDLLPEHENKYLILYNCISCHSLKLIIQNKMPRFSWQKTIKWMQKEHNLKIFKKEEEKKILDYLELFFSQKDTNTYWEKRLVNPLPET